MDLNQWQQPPAPAIQPPGVNQSMAVDAYYASYYANYTNPNPNFISDLQQTHESYSDITIPPPPGVVDTTPYCSLDSNAQNLAWQEAVRLYGTDPLAITGPGATGQPHSIYPPGFSWTDHIVQAQLPVSKKLSKKGKIVQSAYCQVCKVDCNGPSVFEQHILGKKHLKNLEKLKTSLPFNTGSSLPGPTIAVPLIGPRENPCKTKARKKGAESREDLDSKRRRVVECGVSNESIRLCRICNVVCNSDKVYNDHLAGQKHAAKATKAPVNT